MTARPDYPREFRRDVCAAALKQLSRGDSLTLIGVGSSGKSNVARHLARRDVREYHLGARAAGTVAVLVDFLHYAEADVVGMHCALLEGLVKTAQRDDAPDGLARCMNDLLALRRQTAEATSANASRMYVSDALHAAFAAGVTQIYFLLDDFDHALQAAPAPALRSLRGFRDDYKGRLAFAAIMRKEMAYVRPNTQEYEDFYELVSKPVLAVGAYDQTDAGLMMNVLAGGAEVLSPAQRDRVLVMAGGHPGLIRHIFRAAESHKVDIDARDVARQLAARNDVQVECERIWESMTEDEQQAATLLAAGTLRDMSDAALARLKFKTLAVEQGGQADLFSPVFCEFVNDTAARDAADSTSTASVNGNARVMLDAGAHTLTLDGRRIDLLDAVGFRLMERLWQGRNRAVPHRDLMEIVLASRSAAGRFRGAPEDRLHTYMQDLLRRVNLPQRTYVQANADGSYTFLEAG